MPPLNETAPCETPVALLMYRRPALTQRVLDAIGQARPKHLLIIADGPAADRPEDVRLCRETRAVIERVNWPCRVETCFSDVNLGLNQRVVTGLDWVFSKVPEAIILEDDCIPHASFFPFCSELLARYREEERVHMIRGGNFLRGARFARESYYFSRFFHIWGWATWARAFRHYDADMRQWPALRDAGWLEDVLPDARMVPTIRRIFDGVSEGRTGTWDFKWQYSSWLRNAVAISPWANLVRNVGFGPDATHLRDPFHGHARLGHGSVRFPLVHPPSLEIHEAADRREFDNAFPDPASLANLPRRVMGRLRRSLGSVLPSRPY